ncbi:MAG: hypothetical protein IJA94_02415 [Bacilli bacterium]|nr:hypothetical protein [Bacilli bacterium]
MQIEFELQPLFSFSIIPVLIILAIFLSMTAFFIKKFLKPKVVESKKTVKNVSLIKSQFLEKISDLETKFENKKLTSREAYQELSLLIRLFVYELTSLEVHKYTLREIEKINIPVLTELIKEYYDPEFSKLSRGNIKNSIVKTKEVIEKWN